MEFNQGGYQRPPRRRPAFSAFYMGLLGVIIGAVLVYGLFTWQIIPEQRGEPWPPNNGTAENGEDISPRREDLATVEVVNQVMPAVVSVNRYVRVTRSGRQSLVQEGSGSGAVISSDGYIVTNQHVIDGAEEIKVIFPAIGSFDAVLIGEDALTDLALLKIEREGLPYIPMGNSELLQVGETVLAIGNPLGFFQQTVTGGLISAVGRQVSIPDSDYAYTFIQTDAVINPGNSGGPLVNLRGEIIGINSAKVTRLGVEGIGLSIPSNTAERVVSDLQAFGKVSRPQLGVMVEDVAQMTGEPFERGVHIREVIPGSPAEQSGLLGGDIIIGIGDEEVNYLAQLFDTLLTYYPGDEITVILKRDQQSLKVNLVLGQM